MLLHRSSITKSEKKLKNIPMKSKSSLYLKNAQIFLINHFDCGKKTSSLIVNKTCPREEEIENEWNDTIFSYWRRLWKQEKSENCRQYFFRNENDWWNLLSNNNAMTMTAIIQRVSFWWNATLYYGHWVINSNHL